MRSWEIGIYLVGADGEDLSATCFEKATYHLHESFGKRAKQTIKSVPFTIKETGWGEFDMSITLTPVGSPKGGDTTINHDLNFQQERYESTHVIVSIPLRFAILVGVGRVLIGWYNRPSETQNQTSSPSSRNPGQQAKPSTAPQPPNLKNVSRPAATSTWRNSPKHSRSYKKMICFKLCRWCMITRPTTRTLRTILRVSFRSHHHIR